MVLTFPFLTSQAASEPGLDPQQIQAFDQLCRLYRGSSRVMSCFPFISCSSGKQCLESCSSPAPGPQIPRIPAGSREHTELAWQRAWREGSANCPLPAWAARASPACGGSTWKPNPHQRAFTLPACGFYFASTQWQHMQLAGILGRGYLDILQLLGFCF